MSDKLSRERPAETCREHIYHGHRAQSFYISSDNDPELVEIRARQRTFDGAAYRTAMGNLSYAIVILKLFDARFYRIGVLYTVLSIILFILAYLRSQRSKHDFADSHRPGAASTFFTDNTSQPKMDATTTTLRAQAQQAKSKKAFGRAFRTAGWSVVLVSAVVFAVEVTLFILILDL